MDGLLLVWGLALTVVLLGESIDVFVAGSGLGWMLLGLLVFTLCDVDLSHDARASYIWPGW